MKSARQVYAFLLLVTLIASIMFVYVRVSSASLPTIYLEIPTTIEAYENFTVNLNVANVSDLAVWEIRLDWDPAVMELLNVTEGPFLKGANSTAGGLPKNVEGWALAYGYNDADFALPGVNGSGTLANMTFHCTDVGVSTLNLSQTMLFDSSPQSVPWNGTGDVDGDGAVDFYDGVEIAGAWWSYEGDARWDERCDFNGDGFVGVFDVLCLHFNFGRSSPQPSLIPDRIAHIAIDGLVTQSPRRFPITWKWLAVNTPVWYTANASFSEPSKIEGFNFNGTLGQISFNITSASPGNCTVTIPRDVADGSCMDGAFKLLINNTQVPCMLTWNATHTSIYFTYGSGAHSVVVVGQKVTKINGDINLDGVVDIFDAIALSGHYDWKEDP